MTPWIRSRHYFTPATVPEQTMVDLDRFARDSLFMALLHVPWYVNLTVVTHVSRPMVVGELATVIGHESPRQ
jgi:hypothetical protein